MNAGASGASAAPADSAPRLRLRPGTEVFPADDGDVYLLDAVGRSTIVVRSPDESA